jgi:hypothetical protein
VTELLPTYLVGEAVRFGEAKEISNPPKATKFEMVSLFLRNEMSKVCCRS